MAKPMIRIIHEDEIHQQPALQDLAPVRANRCASPPGTEENAKKMLPCRQPTQGLQCEDFTACVISLPEALNGLVRLERFSTIDAHVLSSNSALNELRRAGLGGAQSENTGRILIVDDVATTG